MGHVQQAGGTRLVVQEARANEAVLNEFESGVEDHEISDRDAQGFQILARRRFHVQAQPGVVHAAHGGIDLAIRVGRRVVQQESPAIRTAIMGEQGEILAFE